MAVACPWMQEMFNSASQRYVLLNKILTLGQDKRWRQAALDAIDTQDNAKILDICTGPADLALKIAGKFPRFEIYALDYSPLMLAIARKRARDESRHNIIFKEGDCASLGFESDYFDYVTVSFGLRNLSFSQENLGNALRQIYRVLKEGGRLIIVETSQPENILVRKLFHFYATDIVPRAGRLISGKDAAYSYLGSSIVKFFSQDKLMDVLRSFGFKEEYTKPFMLGIILLCVVKK